MRLKCIIILWVQQLIAVTDVYNNIMEISEYYMTL